MTRTIAALSAARIDGIAESWFGDESWQGADIDLYEISTLLCDVREALAETPGASLFVLLEEKAI